MKTSLTASPRPEISVSPDPSHFFGQMQPSCLAADIELSAFCAEPRDPEILTAWLIPPGSRSNAGGGDSGPKRVVSTVGPSGLDGMVSAVSTNETKSGDPRLSPFAYFRRATLLPVPGWFATGMPDESAAKTSMALAKFGEAKHLDKLR
jgi:hypothetical protein